MSREIVDRREPRRLLAAGHIDTTFGNNGMVFADAHEPVAVLPKADGEVIIAADITTAAATVASSSSAGWRIMSRSHRACLGGVRC